MHIFIGNFTYVSNFMIVEDISSIIDPRLSQVVLGKPFVEIPNMTHDLSIGVAKFTEGTNEIAYKMPYKIEQYNSLSYLEKEHTKSVYLGNEEDKRRRVDYVMSTILWFYKECLKLGPEYLTVLEDKGEPRKDDDFEVDVDLKVLEENLVCHQENDLMVKEKVRHLKKELKIKVLTQMRMR
nr:retrotransposon Orf1 [Tanacetum cinerariifolium]